MDLGVKNKVAIVTGGTSGIGLATVKLLLQEGASVAFCARNEERLHDTEADLEQQFPSDRYIGFVCDVLEEEQVLAFAEGVRSRWGRCDMLIVNAGGGRFSTFASTTDEHWVTETQLKIFSVVYPTRAFLPMLEASGAGGIAIVNSLLAVRPEPHMVATSSTRAAQLNLARSMATEFAPKGIRVNSILVGMIDSGQWQRRYKEQSLGSESYDEYLARIVEKRGLPMQRFGQPEEAARALVFLVSPASSYTTGSSLDLSGGQASHVS